MAQIEPAERRGPPPRDDAYDVAVVGFGPVGATLAGLLGRRGLRVVVLDRAAGMYPLPRAAHIDGTGLRTLQELGCLDEVLPDMILNRGTDCVTADRRLLFNVPSAPVAPSGLPSSMYFHQPSFDVVLRRAASRWTAVDVRLELEVTDLITEGDGVRLRTREADGRFGTVHAAWVVGCDGASSTVRQVAGIDRSSFGFDEQWVIFDLRLRDPRPALATKAIQVCDPSRPHTELPMPADRFRYEFMVMPGEDPAELQQPATAFDRLLRGLVAPDAAVIERAATYTFRAVVADRWRAGRVLVAGDAAHLMPPFLGQGMCSGMRDATNLAWKLDHVVRRGAPTSLLDTYGEERRPHVSAVIEAAVELGRIICTTDAAVAADRDRRMLATGATDPPVRFRLPPLLPGPLVLEGGGQPFPQPAPAADGRRLDDVVGTCFLVVVPDAASAEEETGRWWADALGALVLARPDLPDPDGTLARWLARSSAPFVVVRPDRYVLTASDDLAGVGDHLRDLLVGR